MEETTKLGTQADVARALGISRNAVSKQIKNRERTGAPQPEADGQYDIEKYRKWYLEEFNPRTGPKRGVRAS